MKGKIRKSIRANQELTNKTKARTITGDKWERKKYLQECDKKIKKDKKFTLSKENKGE